MRQRYMSEPTIKEQIDAMGRIRDRLMEAGYPFGEAKIKLSELVTREYPWDGHPPVSED